MKLNQEGGHAFAILEGPIFIDASKGDLTNYGLCFSKQKFQELGAILHSTGNTQIKRNGRKRTQRTQKRKVNKACFSDVFTHDLGRKSEIRARARSRIWIR